MTTAEVGQDLDAWCSRCGLTLAHVVVSKRGTRLHRLECKTCRTVHAYRTGPPKSGRSRAPKAPRKSAYDEQMEGRDRSAALPYAPSGTYRRDDLIRHSKFGVGLVTQLLDARTMTVLFPDGPRRLVFGR